MAPQSLGFGGGLVTTGFGAFVTAGLGGFVTFSSVNGKKIVMNNCDL